MRRVNVKSEEKVSRIRLKTEAIIALVILAVGLVLRLLWVECMPTEPVYDFATYQQLAQNIADGLGHTIDGVPYAWQGCAYPYLLGFFYRIIGSTEVGGAYTLNILMSLGTLVCCFFIYRRVFSDLRYSLAALVVTALLPQYVSYVKVIGTEVMFTFLLSLIVCIQLYFDNKRWSYFLLGILLGMAALTKPFMLVYPLILALIKWTRGKRLKESLLLMGVSALVMVIVITPWAYRNYRLFGRMIVVSYNSGYVLQINNNSNNVNGAWMDLRESYSGDEAAQSELDVMMDGRNIKEAAAVIEPYLKEDAVSWIVGNPLEFIKLGVLRLQQTFFSGANDISQWAANGFELPEDVAARNQYLRDRNTIEGIFNMITCLINAAGILFALSAVARYLRGLFSRTIILDTLTAVCFINIAFFAAIAFVFEGQARYAFPAFLFTIPAAVHMYTAQFKQRP